MRELARAAAGVLVGVLLAEGAVRVALTQTDLASRLAYRYGPAGDQLAWLIARQHPGADAVFEEDPDIGWIAHPGTFHGPDWTATVGPLGVREPSPPAMARTPGTYRLAAFGDSFGFGWDQDDDKTWAAGLLSRVPGLEVANLSVCGHDTGQAWLRYTRDADAWEPDAVVFAYNDLLVSRTVEPFTMYQRPIVHAEQGEFTPVGVPIPSQDDLEAALWRRPQLLMLLDMARYALWEDGEARYRLREARSAALVERFAADVVADGRVMVVVWFPYVEDITQAATRGPKNNALWCPKGTPGVICVDPTDRLMALHLQGVPLKHGSHFSDAAAAAVADAVAEVLSPLVRAKLGEGDADEQVDPREPATPGEAQDLRSP